MSLKAYLRCFAGNQSSILESWPNGYFNDSPSDSEDEVEEDEYSEDDDATRRARVKLRGNLVLRAPPEEVDSYYHVGMIREPLSRLISAFRQVLHDIASFSMEKIFCSQY